MDQTSSKENETRDPFLERLRKEISRWKERGIVDGDIEAKILAEYGEAYHTSVKAERQGRLTRIISILGVILVGVGVFLFLGANWDTIPKELKLLIIFSSIAAAYGSGFWLRLREYEKTGRALEFLGALLYGAGIALVAQIYNIQAGSGTIFLLWAGGVLASGLALRSELFLGFSAVLFAFWTVFARFGEVSFFFFIPDFNLSSSLHYAYFLPAILLFAVAYWLRFDKLIALNIFGFIVWLALAIGQWDVRMETVIIFDLFFGVLLLLLAIVQLALFKLPRRLVLPYSFFGITFILVTSYILSFNSVVQQFSDVAVKELHAPFSVLFWVVALVSILGSIVVAFLPQLIQFIRIGFVGLAILVLFSLFFLYFPITQDPTATPGLYGYGYRAYDIFNPYMLVWNILLAAEIISLIALGYFVQERRYVNMALFAFAVVVITRYFDTFSFYFGTYISFIIGGLLLISLAIVLERFRKKLLAAIAARQATTPTAAVPGVHIPLQ